MIFRRLTGFPLVLVSGGVRSPVAGGSRRHHDGVTLKVNTTAASVAVQAAAAGPVDALTSCALRSTRH